MTTPARVLQPHFQHELIHIRRLVRHDRERGLVELFDAGVAPPAGLTGRFAGKFEAFRIGPGLSQLAELADRTWHPWQGKTLASTASSGDNVLRRNTFRLVRLLAPTYQAFKTDTPTTYRAFPFQTYVAAAQDNPGQAVLKLDYNVPVNPHWPPVRRILDELVQIDDDLFLGKAYVRWWWGAWQHWAFFSLQATLPGQS